MLFRGAAIKVLSILFITASPEYLTQNSKYYIGNILFIEGVLRFDRARAYKDNITGGLLVNRNILNLSARLSFSLLVWLVSC